LTRFLAAEGKSNVSVSLYIYKHAVRSDLLATVRLLSCFKRVAADRPTGAIDRRR